MILEAALIGKSMTPATSASTASGTLDKARRRWAALAAAMGLLALLQQGWPPGAAVAAEQPRPLLLAAAEDDAALAASNQTLRAEIEGYRQALPPDRAAETLKKVEELLAAATQHSEAGEPAAAQTLLQEARGLVIQALTQTRSQETVVYSREFRTPADEYRFEAERFDTYARLMQKVLTERPPPGSMSNAIARAREKAVSLKQQADSLADRGDWKQAIVAMDEANSTLARWLSMMGLPVAR